MASNVGGIPLQIINGYNGFIHEPNDLDGFAQSIIKIIKNPKLQKELGDNGKKHVIEKFSITRLMLDWLNLFESLLDD